MRMVGGSPPVLCQGALLIMAAPDLVNLSGLMDDAKCFAFVRRHRWPEGVRCPGCDSAVVIRHGGDDTQPHRQRYCCKACAGRFDDLTGTVLAGHHQPLRVWVLCLYFMGLNRTRGRFTGSTKLRTGQQRWKALKIRAFHGPNRPMLHLRAREFAPVTWATSLESVHEITELFVSDSAPKAASAQSPHVGPMSYASILSPANLPRTSGSQ